MPRTFVIVLGGSAPDPRAVALLPADRFVVAADSGLDHACDLGLAVDLVVGDLDSVSPAGLARAAAGGVAVERHPVDKDAIDAELALAAACQRGAEHVVVLTGGGDRLDHLLAGLALLARPDLRGRRVEAWVGPAHLLALQGPAQAELSGHPGELVTLLPVHGSAHGIVTDGLRYPLHRETLDAGSSRGVSNALTGGLAHVAVEQGALLVIRPYALGGEP